MSYIMAQADVHEPQKKQGFHAPLTAPALVPNRNASAYIMRCVTIPFQSHRATIFVIKPLTIYIETIYHSVWKRFSDLTE